MTPVEPSFLARSLCNRPNHSALLTKRRDLVWMNLPLVGWSCYAQAESFLTLLYKPSITVLLFYCPSFIFHLYRPKPFSKFPLSQQPLLPQTRQTREGLPPAWGNLGRGKPLVLVGQRLQVLPPPPAWPTTEPLPPPFSCCLFHLPADSICLTSS